MKMRSIAVGFCLIGFSAALSADDEFKTVQARTLELKVPSGWVQKENTSSMRAAEFSIPGNPSDAELVVFYFGGPTGGVKANIERWIGQFQPDGLQLNMYQGTCTAGRYILVDTQGTWNKPDGPPFARKTIATPNSRVLNVIVIEEKDGAEDYYFLKLSGHQDAVGAQAESLRNAIGAKIDSEKKFDLKDAKS